MPHPTGPIDLTVAEQALLTQLTARQPVAGRPAAQHQSHISVPMPAQSPGPRWPPRSDERQRDRR